MEMPGVGTAHPADRADAVGHGGTFMQPNGGAAATVAVKWLDWQLKDDREAAKYFIAADCKLCVDASWKLERKGF